MSNLWYGTIAGDLYARGLGWILRAFRLYDQDYALRQDPESYEKMVREPRIKAGLHRRKLRTAGKGWKLKPASGRYEDMVAASVLEGLLELTPDFLQARYHLAEAVLKGSAWAKITVDQQWVSVGDMPPMRWFFISSLQDTDKRRFGQFPEGYEPTVADYRNNGWLNWDDVPKVSAEAGVRWHWHLFDPLRDGGGQWKKIDRNEWVQHVYDNSESSLGYGHGLGEPIWHYWRAKINLLQQLIAYCERWGEGMLTYQIAEDHDGFATGTDIQTKIEAVAATIDSGRARKCIVFGGKDALKPLDPPPGGSSDIMTAIEYFDGSLSILINGAELTASQGKKGGSYAQAKVHENTEKDNTVFDRALLEETITRDVVTPLWRYNYPILRWLGFGRSNRPKFELVEEEGELPKDNLDVLVGAKALLGMAVKEDEAYRKLSLTKPLRGEPALAPTQAAAAPMLPGGASGGSAGGGGGTGGGPPPSPGFLHQGRQAHGRFGHRADTHEPSPMAQGEQTGNSAPQVAK